MSRRPHKKSRNGCVECKKRHIRCDGGQPGCGNCGAAEKRCSFLGDDPPKVVPGLSYANGRSQPAATSSTLLTAAPIPAQTPGPGNPMSNHAPPDPYSVNMTHVALFNNLLSKEFLSMEESGHPDVIPSALYIQCGLETPYMMHQLLAASALHLSIKTPESRGHYREYATGLQTRALSLFNQSNPILEVTSSNCVQMFMFSSMIGVHLLCDTLYYQRDSLEGFVDSFTHCLAANRGILTVIDQSRNLLHETELGPHLRLPEVLMQSTDGSGSECAALWDLANAADITPSARKAYRDAIFYLQRLFDAQQSSSGDRTRMPMVFVWQAIVPLDYVGLLRQRQPIALVILAHYAVLLHRGRGLWLIGQGGRFLIESIYGSLPDWQPWLKFPITALRDESTAT